MTQDNRPPPPHPSNVPGISPFATPLGYSPPPLQGTSARKVVLIVLAVLLGFGLLGCACLLTSILLPSLNRAREQANRVKCASNLRQIGQAVALYANEHRGEYPDTLDKAMTSGVLATETFVCPASSDTPAPSATAEARAADLSKGGHLSYIYVGKGMNTARGAGAAANSVVAYEPLTNHNNDGTNVLFSDGLVRFVPAAQARQMVTDLQAGTNPPTNAANLKR